MTETAADDAKATRGPAAAAEPENIPTALGVTVPTVGQRRARQRAQAVRARQANPVAAANRVETYRPADPAAARHTPVIRALAAAAGPVDGADATELLTALGALAAWADGQGVDISCAALADERLIARWALVGLDRMSSGSAANYRLRAMRAARAHNLTPTAEPLPLHASDASTAYLLPEEDALLAWADGLRTAYLRADVLVLLCLGMGAGLSTAEIVAAVGTDVRASTGGATVTVRVGGRPRLVPVRRRYARLLLDLASGAGATPLFRPGAPGRGGKNAVSNTVASAREGGSPVAVPVLVPQRMRATWLVRHLTAGTRVDALLEVAGLTSPAVLGRYLAQVPTLPPMLVLEAARGAV